MASRKTHTPNGNYSGYYAKRQHSLVRGDERAALLDPSWAEGKRVLDVGCNAGIVSVEIAQKLRPAHVAGVDIDPELVAQARSHLAYTYSLQLDDQPNFFPVSMPKIHGFRAPPPPAEDESTPAVFPHNVSFFSADWVNEPIPQDDEAGYDLILALSISKWIHLNGRDEGLRRFFRKVFDTLRPGGRFVLEPQAWKGYKEALKKAGSSETLKANMASLELRPPAFAEVLTSLGFESAGYLRALDHPSLEKGFDRSIEVYVKPAKKRRKDGVDSMEDEGARCLEEGGIAQEVPEPLPPRKKKKRKAKDPGSSDVLHS